MKQRIIVGGISAVVLTIGFLTYFLNASPEQVIDTTAPLILVVSGEITVSKDSIERLITSGEYIESPFTLKSNKDGSATVKLADGSELRLDKNSELNITDARYDASTKNLIVRSKLIIGNVWSNIVALATPESSWEVETSNVVATVRGTSFGVGVHENGITTIVGSEHTIELTLINPDTGIRDTNRRIMLDETESIMISNEDGRDESRMPEKQKRTDAQNSDPWVQLNENITDAEAVQNAESPEKNQPLEIKTDATLEIQTAPANSPQDQGTEPQQTPPNSVLVSPTPNTSQGNSTPSATPVSVSIATSPTLTNIVEDDIVTTRATLTYSDGTTRNITNEVTWGVVGKIGSVRGTTFTALLDSSVSEYGKSSGAITATWKNPASGDQILGKTPIFEVKAKTYYLIPEG